METVLVKRWVRHHMLVYGGKWDLPILFVDTAVSANPATLLLGTGIVKMLRHSSGLNGSQIAQQQIHIHFSVVRLQELGNVRPVVSGESVGEMAPRIGGGFRSTAQFDDCRPHTRGDV